MLAPAKVASEPTSVTIGPAFAGWMTVLLAADSIVIAPAAAPSAATTQIAAAQRTQPTRYAATAAAQASATNGHTVSAAHGEHASDTGH